MAAEAVSQPANDDFLELLARVRGGDEAAARELVERYERIVLRSVRTRLGRSMRSAMDSMDVMQSVHRSLLIGLRNERFQMTSPQQLISLAVVMVQRKVARHWRKLKRFSATAADAVASAPLDTFSSIPSPESAPAELAAADDLLDRFLSKLGDFDRRLVQLKLEGHNSVDTATILNCQPAFVRMRWSRLRQILKDSGTDQV
jgi:RNA polymerase sigma factor (sigma-70 family)